jgi:alanyl-tRNA synthetase
MQDEAEAVEGEGGAGGGVLTITGEDVFYLYDTLGFPVDLTELIVQEHN